MEKEQSTVILDIEQCGKHKALEQHGEAIDDGPNGDDQCFVAPPPMDFKQRNEKHRGHRRRREHEPNRAQLGLLWFAVERHDQNDRGQHGHRHKET